MPQFAHLAAVAGTNALIVSDRAKRIFINLKILDGTGQNDIEAINLQSSQAENYWFARNHECHRCLERFIRSRVRIIADNRTNRILIKVILIHANVYAR